MRDNHREQQNPLIRVKGPQLHSGGGDRARGRTSKEQNPKHGFPPECPDVPGGVRGTSSIGINCKLIRNASQTLPTRPTESESGFSETLGDSCAH